MPGRTYQPDCHIMPAAPSRLLLVAAFGALYFIWGSTYLAIRFALQGFPPFFQMASRFLVAGGLLIGWVLWRDGVAGLPTRRQWLHALVIGGLMLGGGMGLIAQAEVHISSGLIATFVAVVPMMVSAWGLLFGKRPTGLELAGMPREKRENKARDMLALVDLAGFEKDRKSVV